jgi:molybdate transport system substrate-binding protein
MTSFLRNFKKNAIIRILMLLVVTGLCINRGLPVTLAQSDMTLNVMSSGGFTVAYQTLSETFTQKTQIVLNTVYGSSMGGASTSIPSRLARGEAADVVILAAEALDNLLEDGYIVAGSRVDLASSQIGMVVQKGSSVPDISTVERFVHTLLEADSIAYSASVSGTYLSADVFHRLNIADRVENKSIRVVGERVGAVVARGEAAIGFQQVSELLPVPGVTYVGTIPSDLQKITMFSAGITTQANNPDIALTLIEFLSSVEVASIITQTGMVPQVRVLTR